MRAGGKFGRYSLAGLFVALLLLAGCSSESGYLAPTTTPTIALTPAATPTIAAAPTRDPSTAASLTEILATFNQTIADKQDSLEDRLLKYKRYTATLVGKRVIAWPAWIVSIRQYDDPYERRLGVTLRDPSLANADYPYYEPDWSAFYDLDAAQLDTLTLGQQITFSGTITAGLRFDGVTIAPLAVPTPPATPLPGDLQIKMRHSVYDMGPVYVVTIDAAGRVDFVDTSEHHLTPPPAMTIPASDLAELVRLFDLINFSSLHNYTWKDDCLDPNPGYSGSVTGEGGEITLTKNGSTKTVGWQGDVVCVPAKLSIVVNKIDLLAKTAQWLGPVVEH